MEKFSNNATTVLSLPLDKESTELTVQSGTGALFPELESGDYFYATIISSLGEMEIVKCVARNLDAFTIERAQQGTQASSFLAGSIVQHRLTAEFLNSMSPILGGDGSVSAANKLTTPRKITIGGKASSDPVEFDGTKDIILSVTSIEPDSISGVLPITKGGTGNTTGTAQDSAQWDKSTKVISSAAPSGTTENQIWFQYL